MSETNFYNTFSQDYDRFVNWESRLASEIPFLLSIISSQKAKENGNQWILDAACGTGHHAIGLAKYGLHCVGVDNSIGMIEIARNNAKKEKVNVTFKLSSFGNFEAAFGGKKFDGLLCLGNSLPHILSKRSLKNALVDFRSVIKDDGILIIQNRNFDKILAEELRWMPPQTYREQDNTWIFSRFYDFGEADRITFNIQILTSRDKDDFSLEIISTFLRPIKKDSLGKMLIKSGFKDLQFYGDLEGSDFIINTSPNLVVVAQAG